MRNILMASVFVLASSPAFATGPFNNNGPTRVDVRTTTSVQQHNSQRVDVRNTNTNANHNANVNINSARGGNASSKATGGNASAATGPVGVSVDASSRDRVVVAPSLGGLSSGVCSGVSGGFSVGFAGFGGGAQAGSVDTRCTVRNTILMLHSIGQSDMAARLAELEYNVVISYFNTPAAPTASTPQPVAVASARTSRCVAPTPEEIRTGMC